MKTYGNAVGAVVASGNNVAWDTFLRLFPRQTDGGHGTWSQLRFQNAASSPVSGQHTLFWGEATISVGATQFTDRVSNNSAGSDAQVCQQVGQSDLHSSNRHERVQNVIERLFSALGENFDKVETFWA